jgi:general secretion pathway protein H
VRTRTSTAGNRGFTLLELVVVIFIAGLAAGVVAVSTGNLRDRARFNAEARKVYQTLRHAREISLVQRRNAVFRVDSDENRYWIDYEGSTSPPHAVPRGLAISGKDIVFFPKGNSSGGRIKLSDPKGHGFAIGVDSVLGTSEIKRF